MIFRTQPRTFLPSRPESLAGGIEDTSTRRKAAPTLASNAVLRAMFFCVLLHGGWHQVSLSPGAFRCFFWEKDGPDASRHQSTQEEFAFFILKSAAKEGSSWAALLPEAAPESSRRAALMVAIIAAHRNVWLCLSQCAAMEANVRAAFLPAFQDLLSPGVALWTPGGPLVYSYSRLINTRNPI